jgi:hypothetical protein
LHSTINNRRWIRIKSNANKSNNVVYNAKAKKRRAEVSLADRRPELDQKNKVAKTTAKRQNEADQVVPTGSQSQLSARRESQAEKLNEADQVVPTGNQSHRAARQESLNKTNCLADARTVLASAQASGWEPASGVSGTRAIHMGPRSLAPYQAAMIKTGLCAVFARLSVVHAK